jgi:hypothetical protein
MYDVKRVLPLLQERSHVLYSGTAAGSHSAAVTWYPGAEERAVPVLTQALTHTACTYTVKIWIFFGHHLAQLHLVSRQKTLTSAPKQFPSSCIQV